MVTSVATILKEKGIPAADSCYRDSCQEMLDFEIVSGDFYEVMHNEQGDAYLRYKNTVDILDFKMLAQKLPQMNATDYTIRDEMPYFVEGIEEIKQKIDQGEKVAVEGGPCLFGTDEVKVEILHRNGEKTYFDYNTGKTYLEHDLQEDGMDFREYVSIHADEIIGLTFENRKNALTPQEWAFIKYPFEIAGALNAPLVIPIPDLSYVKYLDAVLQNVDEQVRLKALDDFRAVSHAICDRYLDLIDQMCRLHPEVHCEVVHERDTEICEKYYKARAPYMDRNKVVRNLTGIPEKLESIKDYVSMPALPFYLYGISNIIEVDSMDETDSFRKCRKAHKGKINLSCILYPELLSKDKQHTIFDAPWEQKEYGAYVVK
ncbi:MAG: hypothetical protein Q4E54_03655 [Lachnospiraceae bacterium]|nr:hypothetical protein [Lachnospiraceae bacterium]